MTNDEITLLLDGEAWIEHESNLYEYIGDKDGKHCFEDINDRMAEPLLVSDNALRHSTELYFTFKY